MNCVGCLLFLRAEPGKGPVLLQLLARPQRAGAVNETGEKLELEGIDFARLDPM